jgi:penicillin amidase
VAHIYAQNQHDLFFAQGYVAAQDRLFQMELWKRSGQGRLAEVLGPSALLRDIDARRLRYRGEMTTEYASYAPDTKEILQAFTDGINAFIDPLEQSSSATRHVELPTGNAGEGARAIQPQALPIEFQMAGFRPEHWRPEDCLNRMAAFSMTGNSFSELAHAQVLVAVGAEKASSLFELDPPVQLDPATDLAGLSPGLLRDLVGSDVRIDFPTYALEGSNNWTVSGALTKSGKPLLANDPHRVIAEPSLRYIVHLVAPGWDVIGAGEPGLPGVALGHNQNVAWGFTIFGLDQQDLYVEELNPADPQQYKTENGWQQMRVEKQTFGIRGGPAVTVDLKFTRHGPVLWEDGKRALALRWVGAEPGTAGYLGSLAVDRAENWEQFEAAMARWKVPSENIVYADREGNIGEHSTGLAPLRKNWTGLLPVPGVGGYEWAGYVPNAELPHSFNPKAGFIATANHKMIPENYPYKVGYEWAPQFRVRRISEVLAGARDRGAKLDVEDLGRLQSDVVSLPARELRGLLRAAAGDGASANEKMILQWDGNVTAESAAGALYEVWMVELTDAVLHRAAPESVWKALDDWTPAQVLKYLTHPTEDGFGAEPSKGRDRVLRESLNLAVVKLTQMEGDDASKWTWGKLHMVRFRHPLDKAPGAEALLDVGPVARPGDEYVVNATGYFGDSYEQVSGASYREILDTSDWDRSVAVNTPGQSGQPGSGHYSDLLPLWSAGDYFPLAYSREAVEKVAGERLVLTP